MASAGVKEIRRLKEEEQTLSGSQSVPSLGVVSEGEDVTYSAPPGEKVIKGGSQSIAQKLYTESERDLLGSFDEAAAAAPPQGGGDVVADAELALGARTPRPYEGLPPESART